MNINLSRLKTILIVTLLIFSNHVFSCSLSYGGSVINVNCSNGNETASQLYKAYKYLRTKGASSLEDMCWKPYIRAKDLAKNQHLYGDMTSFMSPLVMQCSQGLNYAGN